MLKEFDQKQLFDQLRKTIFTKGFQQEQVFGINATLAAWDKLSPKADLRWVAYSLATKYWETARTMQPIREYGRGKGRKYGAPAGPYGQIYYCRGDVQLTWWANYVKATRELRKRGFLRDGEDLERNPDLALDPDIAAAIMILGMTEGWFTTKKLADYFNRTETSWVGARKIINGTDHDDDIARIARAFYAALVAAQPKPVPAPTPEPAPTPVIALPQITQETFDIIVAILKAHVKPDAPPTNTEGSS